MTNIYLTTTNNGCIKLNNPVKHRKRQPYTIALRALFEGRDNNPAHEEFFNSLISGLKKEKSVLG